MTRQPDEDYDVVVHYFGQRGSSGTGRPTWTIWFDGEKQGERRTLEAARDLACDVAAVHSRPAWLLDETGYPLRPIECAGKAGLHPDLESPRSPLGSHAPIWIWALPVPGRLIGGQCNEARLQVWSGV